MLIIKAPFRQAFAFEAGLSLSFSAATLSLS